MYSRKATLLICLLSCLLAPTALAQDAFIQRIVGVQEDSTGGRYDHLTLDEMMDELGVPGVSIAVIKDYEIHWAEAYGIADVETGAPVDVNTVFQAASISKPVAAMAVMKAVQVC